VGTNQINNFDQLLESIATVESNNNPQAYNKKEDAVGLYQIRPIYQKDVNRILGEEKYTSQDRWNPIKSREMVEIYLNHYGKDKSFEEMARIHNGGPRGHEKESTLDYLENIIAAATLPEGFEAKGEEIVPEDFEEYTIIKKPDYAELPVFSEPLPFEEQRKDALAKLESVLKAEETELRRMFRPPKYKGKLVPKMEWKDILEMGSEGLMAEFPSGFPDEETANEYLEKVQRIVNIDEGREQRQQEAIEAFYREHPDKRPRKYKNFIDDCWRNLAGGTMYGGAAFFHLLSQASEASMFNPDTFMEWSTGLYEKSVSNKYGPSVGGGWKGFISNTVARNVPYWATAIGVSYFTGSPLAGAGVAFGYEGEEAYRSALMYGATEDEAHMAMFVTGVVNSAIEYIQINQIMKFGKGASSAKNVVKMASKRALKRIAEYGKQVTLQYAALMASEALQEVLQEITQITVESQFNPDAWDNALERIGSAGAGGSLMGLIFGFGGRVVGGRVVLPTTDSLQKALIDQHDLSEELAKTLINQAEEGANLNHLERQFFTMKLTGKTLEQIQEENAKTEKEKDTTKTEEKPKTTKKSINKQILKLSDELTRQLANINRKGVESFSIEDRKKLEAVFADKERRTGQPITPTEQQKIMKQFVSLKFQKEIDKLKKSLSVLSEENQQQKARKLIHETNVDSQANLEKIGNTISEVLGVGDKILWVFKKLNNQGITGTHIKLTGKLGYGHQITIRIGKKPVKITNQRDINWARKNLGWEVKVGDVIYPEGGLNTKEGNEYAKRVVLHELTHITSAPIRKAGSTRRTVHGPDFVKTLKEEVDFLIDSIQPGHESQKYLDEGAESALKNLPNEREELSTDIGQEEQEAWESPWLTKFIDGLLKKMNIVSKDADTPFNPKDFADIKKYLWMPNYIAMEWDGFRPLYYAARERMVSRTILAHTLDRMFSPYSRLSAKDRKQLDEVLVEVEQNVNDWSVKRETGTKTVFAVIKKDGKKASKVFDTEEEAHEYRDSHLETEYNVEEKEVKTYERIPIKFESASGQRKLKEKGLAENQIEAAISWENTFEFMDNLLIEKMKELGIAEDTINQYRGQHLHYLPHRWYGNWIIQVKDGKGKTVLLNSAKTQVGAQKKAEELRKEHKGQEVKVLKSKEWPSIAFEESPIYAVKQMVAEVFNQMNLEEMDADEQTKDEIRQAANQTLSDIYKNRGFGRVFKKRKNVPGYTKNLLKPGADYINGFTGFITKLDLMHSLADGLKGISKDKLPGLFKYSVEYAKYQIGNSSEFQNMKKLAYVFYLYMNISAASLNLTQSFILGWPELSKYTGNSLMKISQALGEVAWDSTVGKISKAPKFITESEWQEIDKFRASGYIDPRQTMELSGATGNLILRPINKKISKLVKFFDVFRHAEMLNREAMSLALIRSGIHADTPVMATGGTMIPGGKLVDNAHFMYGKANRPSLMRGGLSAIMVFRSFGIHYLFWAKIQIDAVAKKDGKAAGALARSAVALFFFGGFSSFFGMKWLAYIWRRLFGTEIEAELIEALGAVGESLWNGPFSVISGISFSQRVSPTQLPTPEDFQTWPEAIQTIGGVFTDIPIRTAKVMSDINSGDWERALEDFSPQIAKNVLAGDRLRTKGMRDRSGRPVMDYTTNNTFGETPFRLNMHESILKSVGFQPRRMYVQWKLIDAIRAQQSYRNARKQRWADRWNLALINGDRQEIDKIRQELTNYNLKMARLRKGNDIIPFKELAQMILGRQNPNIPPEYMWQHFFELREKYYGDNISPDLKNKSIDFWLKMAEEKE